MNLVSDNNLHLAFAKPQSVMKEGSDARRNRLKALALFGLSLIRHAAKKKEALFSLHVFVSVISVCRPPGMAGWEDEGMEGEATKGCKLIRFLSLHAPLPVLLLSNPGGQRCAAQRLDSQTQWGNNWYKQHLAAETLSVIPSDTFSPLSPVSTSLKVLSAGFKSLLFVVPFLPSSLRSIKSFFWIFTFCLSLTQ